MAEGTSIEWATHTFNTHWGCAEVSPGCDHCYARELAHRFGTEWGVDTPRREFGDAHWAEPLKWDRKAAAAGERHRVFSNSMSDLFDKNAPAGVRERWFALTKATPHLDWLALTKRIGNVAGMLPADWGNGYPNVWLGATVVNQEEADRDIPKLLATPARLHFLSIEPMLGPITLRRFMGQGFGPAPMWVIVGGESGREARPMNPDWARTLRDECAAVSVPFLFKQNGEWAPAEDHPLIPGPGPVHESRYFIETWPKGHSHAGMQRAGSIVVRVGKKAAGRWLDGVEHNGFPEVRP